MKAHNTLTELVETSMALFGDPGRDYDYLL